MSSRQTQVAVDLGERSYSIAIRSDFDFSHCAEYLVDRQILLVSNAEVLAHYGSEVVASLASCSGKQVHQLALPGGESQKNLATIELIYRALLELGFDRQCVLVALGGGIVGDMTGFAAATYQRGVAFIQIPTTLLAQVDSSVGGKTGVNHPLGKNMIGAFYQPKAVHINLLTLKTLPEREIRAGLAEILKYGLLGDAVFFDWLEHRAQAMLTIDLDTMGYAIAHSCQMKAAVVQADEREAGQRALLNLGHTFGHAVETFTDYRSWLHGEAVGLGLLMAAQLSFELGHIEQTALARIRKVLVAYGLPTKAPQGMTEQDFLQNMARDKKVLDGNIRFVLLNPIGNAALFARVDSAVLSRAIASVLSPVKGD